MRWIGHSRFQESLDPLGALRAGTAMQISLRPRARNGKFQRHPGTAPYHVGLGQTGKWRANSEPDSHSEFDRTGEGAKELRPRVGKRITLERRHRDFADPIARAENRCLG